VHHGPKRPVREGMHGNSRRGLIWGIAAEVGMRLQLAGQDAGVGAGGLGIGLLVRQRLTMGPQRRLQRPLVRRQLCQQRQQEPLPVPASHMRNSDHTLLRRFTTRECGALITLSPCAVRLPSMRLHLGDSSLNRIIPLTTAILHFKTQSRARCLGAPKRTGRSPTGAQRQRARQRP